jgi:hypothetical protein
MKITHHLDLHWKGGPRLFVVQDVDESFWFDVLTAAESLDVTKVRALAACDGLGTRRGDGRILLRVDTFDRWVGAMRLSQTKTDTLRGALRRHTKLMAMIEPTPIRNARFSAPVLKKGRDVKFSELRHKDFGVMVAHRGQETWVRIKDVLDMLGGVVHPRAEQMRLAGRKRQVDKARRKEERKKLLKGVDYRPPESRRDALRLVDFSLVKFSFPGGPPAWAIELQYLDTWIEEMRLRARDELQYAFDPTLRIARSIANKIRPRA